MKKQTFVEWLGSDPLAPWLVAFLAIEIFAFIVVPIWGLLLR